MNPGIVYAHRLRSALAPAVTAAAGPGQSPLADLIRKIAYPIFKATTSTFLLGVGSFELSKTARNSPLRPAPLENTAKTSSLAYIAMHGGLIAGSGICGLIETIENFGLATFGSIGNALFKAGNILFLGANMLALEENVRLYQASFSLDDSNDQASIQRLSAIAGISSNLGYIIATSTLLLGGAAGFALAIGGIAACSGGLKILCDFMLWLDEAEYKPMIK